MRFVKLSKDAKTPTRSTSGSAGYDLFAINDAIILPNQTTTMSIGIAIALDDDNTVALIYGRSGLATKHNIALANSVGVIDSDYRGEISVPLINQGDKPYHIKKGERIAQMVLTPIFTPTLMEVSELDETVRGVNGYGSTGK